MSTPPGPMKEYISGLVITYTIHCYKCHQTAEVTESHLDCAIIIDKACGCEMPTFTATGILPQA